MSCPFRRNQLEFPSGPSHFFSLAGYSVIAGGPGGTGITLLDSRTTPAFRTNTDGSMTLLGPTVIAIEAAGYRNENAATNTLAYSQLIGFNDGGGAGTSWSLYGPGAGAPVVTLNSVDVLAPDGTQTASKIVVNATVGSTDASVVYTHLATTPGTSSVYLRSAAGSFTAYIGDYNGNNWTACAVTSTWARFTVTSATAYFMIGNDREFTTQPPAAGYTVYAWGAQAETTAFATSYFPTNTNYIVNSSSVGGTGWSNASSGTAVGITLNSTDVTDPFGGNNASKLIFPTISAVGNTDYAFVDQNSATGYGVGSIWLRTLSGTATLYWTDEGDPTVPTFNITSTWQRFTWPARGQISTYFVIGCDTRGGGSTPGITACTVYAYGAQAENGSVSSSYFQTGASITTTRDLDALTFANPLDPSNPVNWSFGYTATPAGTWTQVFSAGSGVAMQWQMGAQVNPNSMRVVMNSVTDLQFDIWDATATETLLLAAGAVSGSAPLTITYKNAAGVQSSTPGTNSQSGTGTGIITTQPATITLGYGSVTYNFQGWLKNIYIDNK